MNPNDTSGPAGPNAADVRKPAANLIHELAMKIANESFSPGFDTSVQCVARPAQIIAMLYQAIEAGAGAAMEKTEAEVRRRTGLVAEHFAAADRQRQGVATIEKQHLERVVSQDRAKCVAAVKQIGDHLAEKHGETALPTLCVRLVELRLVERK